MSLDAVVWLVAGIGIGIGMSVLLLVVYAGLEHWRLGRRLRRARTRVAIALPDTPFAPLPRRSEPVAPALEAVEAEPEIPVAPVRTSASPEPVVDLPRQSPKPIPAAAEVPLSEPASEPAPAPVADAASEEPPPDAVEPPDAPADSSTTPERPVPAQSIEEMFAEAFALNKVSVAPLPGSGEDDKS